MSWNSEPPTSPPDLRPPHCVCGAQRAEDCICPTCPICGELTGGQYRDLCEDCEREKEKLNETDS